MGRKPLGHKAYGSIPHLPGSRLGPGDHKVSPGQERICCEKTRDKRDRVFTSLKLDGSNCSVAKINGEIVPLGRVGYRTDTSRYEQHRLFSKWVAKRYERFDELLEEGERVVGEWLIQAHGTRYLIKNSDALFAPFDIMRGQERALPFTAEARCLEQGLCFIPYASFTWPIKVKDALDRIVEDMDARHLLYPWKHLDPIEGVVYRVVRDDPRKGLHTDFLAKYVFPGKVDGKYLPELENALVTEEVWNFDRELI